MVILTLNRRNMKLIRNTFIAFSFLLIVGNIQAQEQEDQGDKRPERAAFESTLLLDNQTVIIPTAKTLQFDMAHRFGTFENGKSDLWGLYAPGGNIRMGLAYSLKDNLAIGVGFTKLNKFVDLNLKYSIFKQTRDGSTPISLAYYGNMAIDTREGEIFEVSENPGIHRLSYFHQFIAARRFNKKISLQIAPSFSYFNKVETGMNNYVIGVGLGGRYKFSPQSSIILDISKQVTDHDDPVGLKPNIGIGWEVSTSTHAFQMFISTFKGILPQQNMVFNQNEFDKTGILIGFNMTRLWNF